MEGQASMEMPRYKSHKTVWALKIKEIMQSPFDKVIEGGSYELVPEDARYGAITVPTAWFIKHSPEAGGYYVSYKDGYTSYCPAPQFEEGNTLERELNENLTHHAGIGWAIKEMHDGNKVRRVGWNGKGMYIAIVRGDSWGIGGTEAFDNWGPGDMEPFVAIKNAQGKIIPWNASQGDLLAIDWELAL